MNVWEWKKKKLESNGWYCYYNSSKRCSIFMHDEFELDEFIVTKISMNTLNLIRDYVDGKVKLNTVDLAIKEEQELNSINSTEATYLRNLLKTVPYD